MLFTFKNTILPKIIENKTAGESIRIWIAACATGEEVYSIAMLLLEIQDHTANNIPLQIFASD
jgi:two-component system CheB/CheR fusion protein